MSNRDIALVILAAVVIVTAMGGAVALALISESPEALVAAFAVLTGALNAGSFALGRLSGANGERESV